MCQFDLFLHCLNSLHPNINFTLEPARRTVINGRRAQCLDFLDITIILYDDRKVETDIHYKSTNSHRYLNYNSFHPTHVKDNVPYNLAKRILSFVTDSDKMEYRLRQLKSWLQKCEYPNHIIDKKIFNVRLQGPSPGKANQKDVLPLITTYAGNE